MADIIRKYVDMPSLPKGYSFKTAVDNDDPYARVVKVTLNREAQVLGLRFERPIASHVGAVKRHRNGEQYNIERISMLLGAQLIAEHLESIND